MSSPWARPTSPGKVEREEASFQEWKTEVYGPDIQNGPGKLYKKPGYRM